MITSFERAWVSFISSEGFRRFKKQGISSVFFKRERFGKFVVAKNYVTTYPLRFFSNGYFQEIKTFCAFVGPTKSGSSMLGSLLDAHPEVILADEVDALRYVAAGFTREQILRVLIKRSQRQAMVGRVTGRRMNRYSFKVTDQWQGGFRRLQVVGDSKAGVTTRRMAQKPDLFGQLSQIMGNVNVKFILVIRNPYDPITAMMIRGKRSHASAIKRYFENCDALTTIQSKVGAADIAIVKHEVFIDRPKDNLGRICRFLELDVSEDYLNACAGVLYSRPEKIRTMVAWQPEWVAAVSEKIEQFDFLQGYTFDN